MLVLRSAILGTIMISYELLYEKINQSKTIRDIERLDVVTDALAAQALGRSQILAEQFGLILEEID